MDLKQLEAFVNVVKYKSFSKAAEATFLTQPTISVHIRNLENELGVILVDRQDKELSATAHGKTLYKYATEILSTRDHVKSIFLDTSKNLKGTLEIQTSSTPGQDFVPWMLKEFRDINKNVQFTVEQFDSHKVTENLLTGIGEIGFVGSIMSDELVYEPVFEDEPRLIVANSRPAGQIEGDTISIADFINEPFIWREQGTTWRESSASKVAFHQFLKNHGYRSSSLKIIARINSIGVIRKAVAAGLGVSVVSSSSLGEMDYSMGLKSYKIKEYERPRTFYMVYRKKAYLSPIAESFKTFVLNKSSLNSK